MRDRPRRSPRQERQPLETHDCKAIAGPALGVQNACMLCRLYPVKDKGVLVPAGVAQTVLEKLGVDPKSRDKLEEVMAVLVLVANDGARRVLHDLTADEILGVEDRNRAWDAQLRRQARNLWKRA